MFNIFIILFGKRERVLQVEHGMQVFESRIVFENLEEGRPVIFIDLREAIIPIRGSFCEKTVKKGHTS